VSLAESEGEAMNKHPANNGKVMMSIWVEAPLRDYVRARAMEAKQPVSEWAGNALRKAVLDTSLGAFCFPPDATARGHE
jgi:hypothetical protein